MRLLLLSLLLSFSARAQFIEGYFNAEHRQFYAKANLTGGGMQYDIGKFEKDGYAFVAVEGMVRSKGVMDTSGRIHVPMVYDDLERLSYEQANYFIFRRGAVSGIVDLDGKERYVVPEGTDPKQVHFTTTPLMHIVRIRIADKIGVYSLEKRRFLLDVIYDCAPQYDWPCELCDDGRADIHVESNTAVARKDGMYYAVRLSDGERSEPYRRIYRFSTGIFFLETTDGNTFLDPDAVQPIGNFGPAVVEAFNDHCIATADGKFGLVDNLAEWTIPAVYDDIRFIDDRWVWLKQEGRWAISSYDGEKKTGFDYLDADKINERYLENYLYFTRLDTARATLYSLSDVSFSDRTNEVKDFGRYLLSVQGTRLQYTTYREARRNYLRSLVIKDDGIHTIYLPTLDVDPLAWDDAYIIPQFVDGVNEVIAYRKGTKYGYEPKGIRYRGVLFDTQYMSMLVTRGCRIRKRCIECYVVNYSLRDAVGYWRKQPILPGEYVVR